MGGQKLRRVALFPLGHLLPQRDGGSRIKARLSHEIQADQIRLLFLGAAVGQQDPDLCAQAECSVCARGDAGAAGHHVHNRAHQVLVGEALVAVLGEHVGHLMANDGGQLILGRGDLEQALIDPNLAAGEGEGVDAVLIENDHFPGARIAQRGDEGHRHAADIVAEHRILGLGRFALDLGKRVFTQRLQRRAGEQVQLFATQGRGGAGEHHERQNRDQGEGEQLGGHGNGHPRVLSSGARARRG